METNNYTHTNTKQTLISISAATVAILGLGTMIYTKRQSKI